MAEHPEWDTWYGLSSNMGYGTQKHMDGLKEFGVTAEHRKSYAPVRAAMGLPAKEKFVKKDKTDKGDKGDKPAKKGWMGT